MSGVDDLLRPVGWSEPGRTTLELHTGGWRTRKPVYAEATAPCRAACPAGEPIAGWIERARAGDLAGAWALIREENPFPSVTGRVCAHPCEAACNRNALDDAVAVNALERWVGDWGRRHGAVERPTPVAGGVAVVGGGPAGLACAYHLARFGHPVTIFEAERALGGLLRHGIPAYRLPRTVLDEEIELILALGVTVQCGWRLDGTRLGQLGAFDAVFVATGAGIPLTLDVPGAAAPNVTDGLGMLRAVNQGLRPDLGARVMVVGGGSSAMDVARAARRLGAASVTVVALESRDAMPAIAEETAQALAEGVEIRNGMGVRAILGADARTTAVTIAPARLERRPDGAIVPAFDDGPDTILPVDTVLVAIGQRVALAGETDSDLASLLSLERDERDGLVTVTSCGGTFADSRPGEDRRGTAAAATTLPRVFAGGDLASRQRTVAHAIGSGTRAARAIHAALGADGNQDRSGSAAPLPPDRIGLHAFTPTARAVRWERLASTRVMSFVEVVDGLDEAAFHAETRRCFTCGRCVRCDTCLAVCPDVAITRVEGGYAVSTAHCKGCGLCARECPRGALAMVDER